MHSEMAGIAYRAEAPKNDTHNSTAGASHRASAAVRVKLTIAAYSFRREDRRALRQHAARGQRPTRIVLSQVGC
jgi:hypothetical protein